MRGCAAARLAACGPNSYFAIMNGPKKDIDPATELVEEDDEQSLPEVETAVDLAARAPVRSPPAAPRSCATPSTRRPRRASIA